MAALTITAVGLGEDAQIQKVQVGSSAAAVGSAVYLDTGTGTWKLADADAGITEAGQDGVGILLTKVETANQYGVIVRSGTIYIGTGLTKGTAYVVGSTAGQINPDSDSTSGWYKTVLGVAGDAGAGTNTYDEFIMQPVVSNHAI